MLHWPVNWTQSQVTFTYSYTSWCYISSFTPTFENQQFWSFYWSHVQYCSASVRHINQFSKIINFKSHIAVTLLFWPLTQVELSSVSREPDHRETAIIRSLQKDVGFKLEIWLGHRRRSTELFLAVLMGLCLVGKGTSGHFWAPVCSRSGFHLIYLLRLTLPQSWAMPYSPDQGDLKWQMIFGMFFHQHTESLELTQSNCSFFV